jgi:hypothetical protein
VFNDAHLAVARKNSRAQISRILADILRQAPKDHFTLGWVLSALQQHSFGVVILFLGVLATAPVGSSLPGVALAAVALQLIAGFPKPVFPRFLTGAKLPTRHLIWLGWRAIPPLRYLEKVVHPRWPLVYGLCRKVIGFAVLLLSAALLLTPLPLSNIPPAVLIILIALAYIEEDGLLLSVSIFGSFLLIGSVSLPFW